MAYQYFLNYALWKLRTIYIVDRNGPEQLNGSMYHTADIVYFVCLKKI